MKKLQAIFQVFERMNRFYDGDEGAAAGADGDNSDAANDVVDSNTPDDNTDDTGSDLPYVGNDEFNPDQRPLTIDTSQYSKEQVDEFIEMDRSIVMTDEQYEAHKEEKKLESELVEDTDIKDDKVDDDEKGKKKEDDSKTDEIVDDDEDVKAFYETTKMTSEEFKGLRKEVQEAITSKFDSEVDIESHEKYVGLKKEHNELKESVEGFQKDPLVAARIEELRTGNSYVAKSIPPLSQPERIGIREALDDGDDKLVEKLIDEAVQKKAVSAIKIERSISDHQAAVSKAQQDSWQTLKKLGEIDKTYALGETELQKLNDKHPEWEKFQNGLGKIVQYIQKKEMSHGDVARFGAKELLAAYKAASGLDQIEKKKIADNAKGSLLKKLLNPKQAKDGKRVAKSLKSGKQKVDVTGKSINKQMLVEQFANGDTVEFQKLQDRSAGDEELTRMCGAILKEGTRRREEA